MLCNLISILLFIIHSSPSLFVLGTTRDSGHTCVARKLIQREFCRQSVVSLCHSILVSPAATQHDADNTLRKLHSNHYPEMDKKRKDCRVCSSRGPGEERHFTNTVFGTYSDRPLCIDSCFMLTPTYTLLKN